MSEAVYSLASLSQSPGMYLYLHGFNSSGDSAKGKFFAQALAPITVETPSYPPAPDAAIRHLRQILGQRLATTTSVESITLIGSSLGGFYAQYLARQFKLAVVLINPALQPALTLRPYLGWQKNFYTGERYYFGEDELAQLQRYDIADPCRQPVATLVLLEAGDEVIDYHYAQRHYADCAEVITYPDGNHQFQHLAEATQAIRRFLRKSEINPPDLT